MNTINDKQFHCDADSHLPDDVPFPSDLPDDWSSRPFPGEDWSSHPLPGEMPDDWHKQFETDWKKLEEEFGKLNNPTKPGQYIQDGWRCPVCGRVYAPWVRQCSNCGPKTETNIRYATNTPPSINPYQPYATPYNTMEPSTVEPMGDQKPTTGDPIQRHPSSVCGKPLNS